MDIQEFGKGGLIKKLAIRDYRLEVMPAAGAFPSNFEIIYGGKIKHQDGSGSCVSQATAYYAEVLNFKETGKWVDLSPKFLYAQVHTGYGSYVKDNVALLCSRGITTENLLSSYINGNPPSEQFMTRKEDITANAYDAALEFIARTYVTWDKMNIDSYKQAIMTGNGCIVVAHGNNYLWQNANIMLPDNPQQMTWLHGIYLTGWDDNRKAFKFINSWGSNWGQGGYGYLPYSYLAKGYLYNPMTIVDLPNGTYTMLMKIISALRNLIASFKK